MKRKATNKNLHKASSAKKDENLCAYFSENVSVVENFLNEFEKIYNNSMIKEKVHNIEGAYMYTIVMYLAKVVSESKNDEYSINKFSKIFPALKQEVAKIYSSHNQIIKKIKNNRNWILAHTDAKFLNLCFSEKEAIRRQDILNKQLRTTGDTSLIYHLPKSKRKSMERYSPGDLNDDKAEIRHLLEKSKKLWHDALLLMNLN